MHEITKNKSQGTIGHIIMVLAHACQDVEEIREIPDDLLTHVAHSSSLIAQAVTSELLRRRGTK